MKQNIPRPGEKYRHFKGSLYQVIAVAEHSETREKMVVYQALYGDFGVYVRPYEMFVSEVDREKYPEAEQQMRFQAAEPLIQEAEPEAELNPVIEFLDAGSHAEKIQVLDRLKNQLSENMIQIFADAMDFALTSQDLDSKYYELRNCLVTLEKYEKKR